MRNKLNLKCIILIILGLGESMASCKNEESDIGSSFFQSHANVVVIDTVTAGMETVYLDSIATSSTGVILLGAYHDSVCGDEQVSSYMQLGAPTLKTIAPTAVYDSLCFILKPNEYVLGDTVRDFSFSVHPLNSLIAPAPGKTSLYNTSSFPYDPGAMGSWTGKIYPTRTDSIAVRLSDQFGRSLFAGIVHNPYSLSTDNLFAQNYLKGIVLTGEGDQAIFGFKAADSSGYIRLFYHNASDARTSLHTDFKITQSNLQFNHVVTDRGNTFFKNLSSNTPAVDAALTNGESVLQPINNLAIRLDFPYLKNLLHLGRYVEILSARVTLNPRPGTYSASLPLPPALSLCEVQNNSRVLDSLSNTNGTEHGNLVADYAYNNSHYTYDVTQYFVNEMNITNNYNKTELLLLPPTPAYNTTFRRLVLGSLPANNPGVQVSVQLIMYNAK